MKIEHEQNNVQDHFAEISENLLYIKIDDPETTLVHERLSGNGVKMLYILNNREQNIVKFNVPNECYVQDLIDILPVT